MTLTLVERPKTYNKQLQNVIPVKPNDVTFIVAGKYFQVIDHIEGNSNEFKTDQNTLYTIHGNDKLLEFSCLINKSIELPELKVSEPPEDFIYPELKKHMDIIGTLPDHNLKLRESSVVFQEPATQITYKQIPIAYYWPEKNCMIVGNFDWHKHYARILKWLLNCLDELSIIKPLR